MAVSRSGTDTCEQIVGHRQTVGSAKRAVAITTCHSGVSKISGLVDCRIGSGSSEKPVVRF
jgi:hypothetical protein